MTDSNSKASFPHEEDGSALSARRAWPGRVEQFVGIIRASSNSGEADYGDARYYVDRAVPVEANGSDLLTTQVDALPGLKERVTATNLAEINGNSHLLAAGAIVQVFALEARFSPGVKVYVFNQPPTRAVIVQISSAATGSGEYNGKVLAGVSNATSSAALTLPAGMTAPSSDNALILNVEEDGQSGHRLKNGSYVVGIIRGATHDSPPRFIVVVRGGVGRTDSPATIGGTSDSSESADTSAWSRAGDGSPVNVYVVTRTIYNPAGDKALYSFVRMLSFNARGLLLSVGAESRITVDTTESCP